MAAADVQHPPVLEPAPALPDYLTNPDAVLGDKDAKWRYGRAPDYSKTRKVFAESKSFCPTYQDSTNTSSAKQMTHTAGSLPDLVQNLVKNWEVEASFKPVISDWRTIDHPNYSFAINGSAPEGAEAMLKVGTYNAIIAPNEYYSPVYSDFASSHKTFKRMMPTFAWEVLEVYSGPPTVSFRWRHWGVMKNDYVGINNKGEKVTAKAHGGEIDIQGVTVATVNEKVQLQVVRTWFDPMDMFRQIAPEGVVKKEVVPEGVAPADVVEDAQQGVQVSEDQELPDAFVQTEEEVRQTLRELDIKAEKEERNVGERREVPDGHPAIPGAFMADEDVGGCPFMAQGR